MTSATAFRFSSLSLIAAAVVGALTSATTTAQPSTTPSIVLVHGAFVDAGSWAPVTGILQRDGYNVTALDDQAIHPDLQRFYAHRMKARTSELKASHSVMMSRAPEIARVITDAAQSTICGSQR